MTVLASHAHKGGVIVVGPGHGGCGKAHKYEIGPTGYPEFTCHAGCEDFARSDSQHATMPAKVPEDYDEKITREDLEQRSLKHRDLILAIAAARSAGMTAEADLLALQAGLPLPGASVTCAQGHKNSPSQKFCGTCGSAIAQASVLCADGHDNLPGARFCSTCGMMMNRSPARGLDAPQRHAEPAAAAASLHPGSRPFRLQDLRHDELQTACRAKGLPDQGVRKELMKRLRNAGVTNADLQPLFVAA